MCKHFNSRFILIQFITHKQLKKIQVKHILHTAW